MPSKSQRLRLRRKASKLEKVPMKEEVVRNWQTVATKGDYEEADKVREGLKNEFKNMELADEDFRPLVKIKKSPDGRFLVKVAKGTKKVKHIDYEKVAALL